MLLQITWHWQFVWRLTVDWNDKFIPRERTHLVLSYEYRSCIYICDQWISRSASSFVYYNQGLPRWLYIRVCLQEISAKTDIAKTRPTQVCSLIVIVINFKAFVWHGPCTGMMEYVRKSWFSTCMDNIRNINDTYFNLNRWTYPFFFRYIARRNYKNILECIVPYFEWRGPN